MKGMIEKRDERPINTTEKLGTTHGKSGGDQINFKVALHGE